MRLSKLTWLLLVTSFADFGWSGQGMAVSLKDDRGREVQVDSAPLRIASGSLASDEVALALLERSGHPERLIGVSLLADDARYSSITPVPKSIKARIGSDLEALLVLKPDLVLLARYNKPETIARIEQANIKCFVLPNYESMQDIDKSITMIGALLHLDKEAKELRDRFVRDLEALREKGRKLARQPKLAHFYEDGGTSGKHTLFDDIVTAAGGINVVAAMGLSGWPQLGAESLARLDVDAIVAGGEEKDRDAVLRRARNLPGWKETRAVREGRVIMVPDPALGAVSQHVLKAVVSLHEQLAKLVNGEALPKK